MPTRPSCSFALGHDSFAVNLTIFFQENSQPSGVLPMHVRSLVVCAIAMSAFTCLYAQGPRGNPLTPEERAVLIAHRENVEKELEDIAIIDRKVMFPMR